MADRGPRLWGTAPAGPRWQAALQRLVRPGTFVTAFEDVDLKTAKTVIQAEDVEFVPFLELASRFLTVCGEASQPTVSTGQLRALAGELCAGLPPEDPLAASAAYPGAHELLAETLSELRLWGAEPADLAQASLLAEPDLSAKLASLASLLAQAEDRLADLGREFPSRRVQRVMALNPQHLGPFRHVVVLAGAVEKPLWEGLVAWMNRRGIKVDVLLEARPDRDGLFEVSDRVASRMGRKLQRIHMEPAWHDHLFRDESPETAIRLAVWTAPDPLAEAEWALRACQTKLREGWLPHEMAIFARDMETYAPLLRAAAARFGAPLNAPVTAPLLSNGFARIVLETLQALAGLDVRRIHRLLRSTYYPKQPGDLELVWEAVAEFCREPATQWQRLEAWARQKGGELEWIAEAVAWRERLAGERQDLKFWHGQLRALVGEGCLIHATMSGDDTAERDHRAGRQMQASLSDVAFVWNQTRREPLTLQGFVEAAGQLWQRSTYIQPGDPNGIVLAGNPSGLGSKRAVWSLGMLEGSLPRRRSENPLLHDGDRIELAKFTAGRIALPTSHQIAAAERDVFVRLCASATEELTFTYPQTDEDRDNVPAFYLDEIQRLGGDAMERRDYGRRQLAPDPGECRSLADLRLAEAMMEPAVAAEPVELRSQEARALILPQWEEGINPRELQEALACPFQAAFRHRLGERGSRSRQLSSLLLHAPVEAGLPLASDPSTAAAQLRSVVRAALDRLYPSLEEWELRTLEAASHRMVAGWVEREFAARSVWPRDEDSVRSGPSFESGDLRQEVKVGDLKVTFKGSFASLHVSGGSTVLVDYRSSAKVGSAEGDDVSPDLLQDGLILMALASAGAASPALEIDGLSERTRVEAYAAARPRMDNKRGLKSTALRLYQNQAERTVARASLATGVRNRLREAVDVLSAGRMNPTPGERCDTCSFADLCRRSRNDHEDADPFEEEA